MEIELTPDQRAFAREAVKSGRLKHAKDAVREALLMWEERERERAELIYDLNEADAAVARGEWRRHTRESLLALASDIKRKNRARLSANRDNGR